MGKVDTDKFIALLVETFCRQQGIDRTLVRTLLDDVLEQMGFKVENGEIVELKPTATQEGNNALAYKLSDYTLSVRTLKRLSANGITTVRDLVRRQKDDLLKCRGCGKKMVIELDGFIHGLNLAWGMDV